MCPCGVSVRWAQAPRVCITARTAAAVVRVRDLFSPVVLDMRHVTPVFMLVTVWYLVRGYLIFVLLVVRALRAECGTLPHPLQVFQGLCRFQVAWHRHPLIVSVAKHWLNAPQGIESVSHLVFAPNAAHRHHQVESDTFYLTTGLWNLDIINMRVSKGGLPSILDEEGRLTSPVKHFLHRHSHLPVRVWLLLKTQNHLKCNKHIQQRAMSDEGIWGGRKGYIQNVAAHAEGKDKCLKLQQKDGGSRFKVRLRWIPVGAASRSPSRLSFACSRGVPCWNRIASRLCECDCTDSPNVLIIPVKSYSFRYQRLMFTLILWAQACASTTHLGRRWRPVQTQLGFVVLRLLSRGPVRLVMGDKPLLARIKWKCTKNKN